MKCENFEICVNNSFCHRCEGQRLFKKLPHLIRKEKEQQKKEQKRQVGYKRKPKEGMGFEKDVAKRINQASNRKAPAARRRPGSGAFWSMPGDIVTKDGLLECKERGTTTSKGEKTITIHQEWLQKARQESIFAHKQWSLPFRFKGDEEIYLVKSFQDELEMVEIMEAMREQIEMLQEQLLGRHDDD